MNNLEFKQSKFDTYTKNPRIKKLYKLKLK